MPSRYDDQANNAVHHHDGVVDAIGLVHAPLTPPPPTQFVLKHATVGNTGMLPGVYMIKQDKSELSQHASVSTSKSASSRARSRARLHLSIAPDDSLSLVYKTLKKSSSPIDPPAFCFQAQNVQAVVTERPRRKALLDVVALAQEGVLKPKSAGRASIGRSKAQPKGKVEKENVKNGNVTADEHTESNSSSNAAPAPIEVDQTVVEAGRRASQPGAKAKSKGKEKEKVFASSDSDSFDEGDEDSFDDEDDEDDHGGADDDHEGRAKRTVAKMLLSGEGPSSGRKRSKTQDAAGGAVKKKSRHMRVSLPSQSFSLEVTRPANQNRPPTQQSMPRSSSPTLSSLDPHSQMHNGDSSSTVEDTVILNGERLSREAALAAKTLKHEPERFYRPPSQVPAPFSDELDEDPSTLLTLSVGDFQRIAAVAHQQITELNAQLNRDEDELNRKRQEFVRARHEYEQAQQNRQRLTGIRDLALAQLRSCERVLHHAPRQRGLDNEDTANEGDDSAEAAVQAARAVLPEHFQNGLGKGRSSSKAT
ncbi:hypothetical protein OIO90_000516 [Microbotryomycetes sp. JL221]|nr:hypothetical protein OIO90_000516 [Microbotryomycetes sp. JL221]